MHCSVIFIKITRLTSYISGLKNLQRNLDVQMHFVIAQKLLKEEFDNNSTSVRLMISKDGEIIKFIESYKVSLVQLEQDLISERKKYDELLRTHPDLKFMEYGTAGRISFDVIPSENEEGQDNIRFKELERAPIIDINKRQFRCSFSLSVDYRLLGNTKLFGNSTKEELLLFANRSLINKNPIQSVVSLLGPGYGATAFRVSPLGGLITCYHNLSSDDHLPIEKELCIHKSVVSISFEYAASEREKVEFIACKLPNLEDSVKDPLDAQDRLTVNLKHSDIAFLKSSAHEAFLIPACATDLDIGEAVVCIGYPREVSTRLIEQAYCDVMPQQVPDKEEYGKLFKAGHLSISPGPLLAYNSSALACEIASTPGFSGSPVCLLKNPRMFIGIHYRARRGKDYTLSVSVKDPGFYQLYSTLVVPELRDAELCQEDIDAINNYLSIGGDTQLITR